MEVKPKFEISYTEEVIEFLNSPRHKNKGQDYI